MKNKKIIIIILAAVLAAGGVAAAVIFGGRHAGRHKVENESTSGSSVSETEVVQQEETYITDGVTVSDLFAYSGRYVEDSLDEEVSGIAAVRLKNIGEKNYEYLEFTLKTAGEEYAFKASGILAGTEVTVLSADKKKLTSACVGGHLGGSRLPAHFMGETLSVPHQGR